jgi:hypothetical protein
MATKPPAPKPEEQDALRLQQLRRIAAWTEQQRSKPVQMPSHEEAAEAS